MTVLNFLRGRTHPAPGERPSARKMRGLTLTETLLALALTGVAITQGYSGAYSYNESLKVSAVAGKISQFDRALQQFSKDNYDTLVAAAPAEYTIDVLEPYLPAQPTQDAFGNTYAISTRAIDDTVGDPATGGTRTRKSLQTLLIANKPAGTTSPLDDSVVLRIKTANKAGANAGFISQDEADCRRPNGTLSSDGYICGAYGAYAINPGDFSASTFNDAVLVNLVTTSESATEDDRLFRFSYGNEELSTMRTDMRMDGNTISGTDEVAFKGATPELSSESGTLHVETDLNLRSNNIGQVDTVTARGLTLSGGTQNITTNSGNINISSAANILARAQNIAQLDLGRNGGATANRLELVQRDSRFPTINGSAGALQLGLGRNYLQAGEDKDFVSPSGNVARMGASGVGLTQLQTRTALANEIRAVYTDSDEELALQNVPGGTVTLGRKEADLASGPDGTEFEISDGTLILGELQTKTILCDECPVGGGFADHAWYNAQSLGVFNPGYVGTQVFENFTREPIQISSWDKHDSSDGFRVYVRPMGVNGADWIQVHDDTNEGSSGIAPIVPYFWEVMIWGGPRAAYLLLPKTSHIKENHSAEYRRRWSILPPDLSSGNEKDGGPWTRN